MNCIRCASERTRTDGQTRLGGQRWRCYDCGRRFTARSTSALAQRAPHHGFPNDVIALAVRWHVRYRLSYADVVEWFAERGLVVDRSTVYRWVQRFLPLFGKAARAHRRPVGTTWRVAETYARLNGTWTSIYRAIDEDGQVVDAYFSKRRNAQAAQRFFERASDETGVKPERVTTDKAKCYPPALRTVLPGVEHRTSKYLNNGIERNHGHLKQRLYPLRGFKQAASADTIARGHALVRNLRNSCSALTLHVPLNLRLAVAWPQLAQAI
ncbi:MAG: IS6 family transposase [Chloroflexota bacterium]|nr:IS6 family transposase [Chloroflexota bacterium]